MVALPRENGEPWLFDTARRPAAVVLTEHSPAPLLGRAGSHPDSTVAGARLKNPLALSSPECGKTGQIHWPF